MTESHAAIATSDGATPRAPRVRRAFPVKMRWKLLASFAGAFTIVFVFIAIWVLQYTTNAAHARLVSNLALTSEGAAKSMDAANFAALVATVAAVPDDARQERDHQGNAGEVFDGVKKAHRRPQLPRGSYFLAPRRRPRAAVPVDRFSAREDRNSGEGGLDRI